MLMNPMQKDIFLQTVKWKMALLDKLNNKWNEYIRKQEELKRETGENKKGKKENQGGRMYITEGDTQYTQ